MVRSLFPGWSAIRWWDIAPSAQTERRGGAGPAGGLLGGKDPAGRFRSGVRGQQNQMRPDSYSFFASHPSVSSPPRGSPRWPGQHITWTNTPPAIDLLVRLFEPAAGLCLVMSPFLLGQAVFGSELGVSQGEDDPLTAVARAPWLQLARLLQGFDAGLPVSDPVLNPSQVLPGVSSVWSKFDCLLLAGDGLVQLLLVRRDIAEAVVGSGIPRRDRDGSLKIGDGCL